MLRKSLMAGCFLLSPITTLAEGPRTGAEFQVNSFTWDDQIYVNVARGADGGFVVVWESEGSYGDDDLNESIQFQRYDMTGTALGGPYEVNTYTTGFQGRPAVASDPSGNFVIVWQSLGSNGTDNQYTSIQARRFSDDGSPLSEQFQVNTFTTHLQDNPRVSRNAAGDFVVVWQSHGSSGGDTDQTSIQAQRFLNDGNPVGNQFQVNSYTTSQQFLPSVASDPGGNFVVAWSSEGSNDTDTSDFSVQARRYDAAGTPLGDQFQVNTITANLQSNASVAVSVDGEFVVAWQGFGSSGTDSSGASIQARRFASDGAAHGEEWQVNSYTSASQFRPGVAMDSDGNFVVAWMSFGSDGTDSANFSAQARLFTASGAPAGRQFQVNSYTTDSQFNPAVAMDPEGEFVAVWQSTGSSGTDSSGWSVQAQRFVAVLFFDDFESGDPSNWSDGVP